MGAAGERVGAVAILLALVLCAVLYLMAVGPYWKISPDSVSYVSAAVSLASGQGYSEAGKPVILFPPVTSLMFSIAILLFPGSYLALNALVTVFALLAHAAAFVLLRKQVSSVRAAVSVLLSLGSILMFYTSTLLLSDILYFFWSMVALAAAEHLSERQSTRAQQLTLAVIVWIACMTRIAGVTLVAAIVCHSLISPQRKEVRRSLLVFMLLVALTIALWEVRSLRLGTSYLKLTLQNEPWVDEAGYASPLGQLRKFYHNLDDYGVIGDILTNDIFRDQWTYTGLLARGIPLALFCLGLAHSIRRRITVTDIYCAIYLLVSGLYFTYIDIRFFVPIMPLLFHYALVGGHAILEQARLRLRRLAPTIARIGLAVYVAGFVWAGVAEMVRAVPGEHTSPFGAHPIKYVHNYDLQRLGLWLRDNSAPYETYVCQHADLVGYITEREGYNFPFSADPDKVVDALEAKQVTYVLADKKKEMVQQFLLPAIQAYPDRFTLIQDQEDASLYEFTLQP